MPIEIRELVIKAEIDGGTKSSTGKTASTQQSALSEELIQEIVDKVIEVLDQKSER